MEGNRGLFSRDFTLWLAARFCSNLGRSVIEVALAWEVYRISRSPVALGLMGLTEAVPFLLASPWAGHVVDRGDKKPFMLAAVGALLAVSAALLALAFLAPDRLWPLYAAVGAIGAAVSFGSVASTVYLQMLVPGEGFSRAAAWNLASFTTATIAGPLLGGELLAGGPAWRVYALSAALFLGAAGLVLLLRFRPPRSAGAADEPALGRVREGVRFVRSRPLIMACMSLDMVAVLFGDAVAIFPIFADIHQEGAFGYGVLRAAPAAGSALVSLAQALRPFIRPSWRWLKRVVAVFGLCMIAFALSKNFALAVCFLVIEGAADGVSVIIRQSVYQANTPDRLRGRVSALSGIFISTSNEIGAFESGLAARLLGAVPSVVFGGCVTLASVAGMGWVFRGIKEEPPARG